MSHLSEQALHNLRIVGTICGVLFLVVVLAARRVAQQMVALIDRIERGDAP